MTDVERMEPASIGSPKKPTHTLIVLLGIGAIAILAYLLYYTLTFRAFWLSLELKQNQAKWESQHITHYRMSFDLPYSYINYDRMPLTVEVKDGKVVSVVDARGETISPEGDKNTANVYPYPFTIPGLFSYIYQAIWERPPVIQVSYDPALGYPESIYIDPYSEPCCQDFTFGVQDLQVLPP
jgi:hypothetical protein